MGYFAYIKICSSFSYIELPLGYGNCIHYDTHNNNISCSACLHILTLGNPAKSIM